MFLHTLCYKYPSTTTVFSAFTSIGYCVFLEILLNELFPPPLENRLCEMRDWVLFSLPAQYRVATQKKTEWMNAIYRLCFPLLKCFVFFSVPLHFLPLLEHLPNQLPYKKILHSDHLSIPFAAVYSVFCSLEFKTFNLLNAHHTWGYLFNIYLPCWI